MVSLQRPSNCASNNSSDRIINNLGCERMKVMISMLAFICLAGVVSPVRAQRELTLKEVRQVERALPRLKVGMSLAEVYKILGKRVSELERSGSGPHDDYRVVHYLRKGYNLIIVWDAERKFKRAEMAGEEWRKEQRQSGP